MTKMKKSKPVDKQPKDIKNKLAELLDIPREVVLNIPKFTIIGNNDMIIENYKGIIEYDTSKIRINTGVGVVKVCGAKLVLKEITSEDLLIKGQILSIEFIR